MKLSVMLPTRGGERYLTDCIESVLGQDDEELELVVSDNANTDATPAILERFSADERLRVVRLEEPVSVTENWNAALEATTGDYLLMIGDDDCLLPKFTARLRALLDRNSWPECITYNAYGFMSPGAVSDVATGALADPLFDYGEGFGGERSLSASFRHELVEALYRFTPRLPLNLQTTVFARRAVQRLPGAPFKPPFPDHYALVGLLLTAEHWVYAPEQLLIVGITPKSFGHYIYSGDQAGGLSYLGISTAFPGRLPGNELINAMHIWLELAQRDFGDHLEGVEISRGHYVARQLWAWLQGVKSHHLSAAEAGRNLASLRPTDWIALARAACTRPFLRDVRRRLARSRRRRGGRVWGNLRPVAVRDIGECARLISADRF